MAKWRLYIDESGDHSYKHVDDPDKRYLGLTGVLVAKDLYDSRAKPGLEALKQSIFRYDPDDPPILTRSLIKSRKRWFYVLQDAALNARWESELLNFLESLTHYTHIFTVVIDKKEHLEQYPFQTFDPYVYSLAVLMNRVRGFLHSRGDIADVLAESRGKVEDDQIKLAYKDLLENGSIHYGDGLYYRTYYPEAELIVKRKDQNIAGLQIADIVAYGQKVMTIQHNRKPFPRPVSGFTQSVNDKVNRMVNRYGRYMLK